MTAKDNSLGSIFSHTFFLLAWNLIARCVSISSLMFEHISWSEDAMVIVFPSHKGDKEGHNTAPKHVYANPLNPFICPILSFAIYIFTTGYRRGGSKTSVFEGDVDNTESKFSKWFKKFVVDRAATLLAMGVIIAEIGTHSFRKGIATFLSSMPGGPSPISIYIRAGWSLGVQSRYILEGGGGDQVCGRAASGLNLCDSEFAELPPHFNPNDQVVISLDEWESILPGYSTFYPSSFRQVIPFLLASLSFHRDWLKANLHAQHNLFNQPVWTSGILDRVASKVLTGNGRNTESGLCATGIPPHILLANEIVKVRHDMNSMKSEIFTKLNDLPNELKATMLQNFNIAGL